LEPLCGSCLRLKDILSSSLQWLTTCLTVTFISSALSPTSICRGDVTVTAWSVVMRLPDNHVVNISIDSTVNLPVIPHPQPTLKKQDNFGPHLLSSIVANTLHLSGLAKPVCCNTMADVSNKNLAGPQRELIQWHSKLCINMNHVQELMHDCHYKIPDDADLVLPPILLTKNATARSCCSFLFSPTMPCMWPLISETLLN
jgi:hypothetical protein